MKILIVDDLEFMRKTLKRVIQKLTEEIKVEVIEAENGFKGLELVQKEIPDLVITDFSMPKMNGIEMAKQIKKNDGLIKKIPIILISGNLDLGNNELLVQALNAGIDKCLSKPFSREELVSVIKKLLPGL